MAVTHCKAGRGLIKINGVSNELVQPEILRYKAFEPILLLGRSKFASVDMRIRVKDGGYTSQIYAIHQSILKAFVAYYQKFVDKEQKKEMMGGDGRPYNMSVGVKAFTLKRYLEDLFCKVVKLVQSPINRHLGGNNEGNVAFKM